MSVIVSNVSCFQKYMKSMCLCVYLPYALCHYLTCTCAHIHTHFFFPSVFPMLSQGFRYVTFHFFLSRAFSGAALICFISLIRSIHLFFSRPRGHRPSGLKRNAQHTHTHTHTHTHKVFDLTLSLPILGCCIFLFHFSSSLTFLSSVGVCACFPPRSLSLSLSFPYGQNSLNTQLCRSIWQLNNCSPYMLRMSSITSSVWESVSENFG